MAADATVAAFAAPAALLASRRTWLSVPLVWHAGSWTFRVGACATLSVAVTLRGVPRLADYRAMGRWSLRCMPSFAATFGRFPLRGNCGPTWTRPARRTSQLWFQVRGLALRGAGLDCAAPQPQIGAFWSRTGRVRRRWARLRITGRCWPEAQSGSCSLLDGSTPTQNSRQPIDDAEPDPRGASRFARVLADRPRGHHCRSGFEAPQPAGRDRSQDLSLQSPRGHPIPRTSPRTQSGAR